MPGRYWHIEVTRKGGKKYLSLNHPSRSAAIRFADDEGAVDWRVIASTERRLPVRTPPTAR